MLVLDSAPPELVRTKSYLQRQTEGRITLDLFTIASDSVGGTEIVVPQHVDGEAPALDASQPSAKSVRKGEPSEGGRGRGLRRRVARAGAKLQLSRSVFERYAPAFIAPLEVATGGPASRGGYVRRDAEVLLVAEAYRHAAAR